MQVFEMVVLVVAIVTVGRIVSAKYGLRGRRGCSSDDVQAMPDPEAQRMREEIKALKDRVAVLERLATDSSTALEREFEKLKSQP